MLGLLVQLSYLFGATLSGVAFAQEPSVHFASGIKIGETDQDSALVWARLTQSKSADFKKLPIFTEGLPTNERSQLAMPTGVVAGTPGQIRVLYWLFDEKEKEGEKLGTDWVAVTAKSDFIHQFKLEKLRPNSNYRISVEGRKDESDKAIKRVVGHFKTAPIPTDAAPIRFIVSTCQAVRSIDSGKKGHVAYEQMLKFDPHFFVHTGDILYYDKVPLCKNVAQARAKWNLMFAYEHNQTFHKNVSSYFMKDDHDTLKNDCWPGQKYGDLTFDQGLSIFREQVTMGEKTYRTYRWGKDVQIWMTENRDFRSPNRMKDGPDKTILGAAQKEWLKKTISESDATFKFLITPGPIVGPDKRGKADNHSNANFSHEGQELRDFVAKQKNTYIICGDRHWQYCSKDPKTGILEFGCGPINDEHSFGGNSGNKPEFHRYFSGKGGFLGITVDGGQAKVQWFTSNKIDPKTKAPKIRHTEILPLK